MSLSLPVSRQLPAEPGPVPEPGPAEPRLEPGDGLFRKLVWLTLFRLAMVTVLLGVSAYTFRGPGADDRLAIAPIYLLIAITYLASLGFALLLRARLFLRWVAYGQVLLDVGIAAGVVATTGYSDSVFIFMFLLAIVNGSILLYRWGAIASAALALAVYLVLSLGVDPHGRAVPALTRFIHASAFAITAMLASYLAEQLRRTGERLAERESDLAAITALHEAIVQSVEAGLLTVDGKGRVSFLNRAGEQMTGLTVMQVRGQPAARWFSAFQTRTRRDETDFVNARGEKLRIGFDSLPLLARHGEQIGRVLIFQDLTRLRSMEAAVQRSARLAELGRVAAGLAHELRNPLASMSGSIELLRASLPLGEEDGRLMEIVVREATRLNQLVTRFLEFTRPAPPRRVRTDLAQVLGDTLTVFANDPAAAQVELERTLSPVPVTCDPDQIRQVVWNLLANAAQAIASPGEGSRGTIRIRCGPDGSGGGRVAIEDDGPGIAEGDLGKIFMPFFTTKEQGTGLGLAIVERILDAHGGSILVDSRPGEGTTFTFRLPAAEPDERELAAPE